MDAEFLSKSEIESLTGYKRCTEQAEWLVHMGLPHKTVGSRVILSRLHVRMWLEGKPIRQSAGPRLDLVR